VLPTISMPTLVIHATDDDCVSIDNGRFLADNIKGARLAEINGGS
jgi:pimeloyl-ACP methyl ester carboxylesterase